MKTADEMVRTDVLIIGAGMAGLTCALSLPDEVKALLLSKEILPAGSTELAQGGLAAVVSPDDSFELHVKDTIKAGGGLVDKQVAEEIIGYSPHLIERLNSSGAVLDGAAGKENGGIEGGHSFRRVLHHKDRTGRFISEKLIDSVRSKPNITVLENAFAINLLTASREMQHLLECNTDCCLGAHILKDRTIFTVLAGETVIASGGAGKVYRYTSNSDFTTGDGIAMAYRAGLPLRNMEFFQFHPTCLFHPEKRNFLITEALRGEGAQLLNLDGHRFMSDYDSERMELAPRDIVARAIDSEMKMLGHDHVLLDTTCIGRNELENSFPEVSEGVQSVGIVPWKEPIPVVPAAHYCVGGVVASIDGTTEMNGLRVIGESASTGFHGANRLGSNSLLEAGVMGIKAGESIPSTLRNSADYIAQNWFFGRAEPIREAVLIDHAWAAIRTVMWDYVGIVRSDKRLNRAMNIIEVLNSEVEEDYWSNIPTTDLLELRNICSIAESIVSSALQRRESRGLHFSTDCPDTYRTGRDTVIRMIH